MKTIRHQLLVGLLGGALACTAIAGYAIFLNVSEEANELFDYQLRQLAANAPNREMQPSAPRAHGDPEEDIVVQRWDQNGNLLFASAKQLVPRAAAPGYSTLDTQRQRWRIYAEVRGGQLVQVAQAMSARENLAAGLALRSLLPFLLMLPVLAVLIYVVVGQSLRPLGRVAKALGQRSARALQPLPMEGHPPEVVPMIRALNDLFGQLDLALARQRAFVADAAHELRSPLTALKLQLQLAERAQDNEQRTLAFAKLHGRLDRSTHLVKQLLASARYESQSSNPAPAAVDLLEVAQQCVADRFIDASAKGIDLGVTHSSAACVVLGNADDLAVLLGNLIDNAVRYTPPNGRVDVTVENEHDRTVLAVSDSGPGIAEAERERVFDRFYRGERHDGYGSGLGLSIARSVAAAHNAEVELSDNRSGNGLRVSVSFRTK